MTLSLRTYPFMWYKINYIYKFVVVFMNLPFFSFIGPFICIISSHFGKFNKHWSTESTLIAFDYTANFIQHAAKIYKCSYLLISLIMMWYLFDGYHSDTYTGSVFSFWGTDPSKSFNVYFLVSFISYIIIYLWFILYPHITD